MHLQNTRQEMYVQRNIQARSRNHFRCGKAKSIKYYECVSVFLHSYPVRKVHAPYYIVIYACLSLPYFLHCLINGTIFRKKLLNIKCAF
jgi:hypothetical protein